MESNSKLSTQEDTPYPDVPMPVALVRSIWAESRNFSQFSEASLALSPMNILGSSTVKLLRALEPSALHLGICCQRCGFVCVPAHLEVHTCTSVYKHSGVHKHSGGHRLGLTWYPQGPGPEEENSMIQTTSAADASSVCSVTGDTGSLEGGKGRQLYFTKNADNLKSFYRLIFLICQSRKKKEYI